MSSTYTTASAPVRAPEAGPWIGRSVQRFEDAALLTGRGRYGDDIGVKPGTLQAAILRSPYAHARIRSIDAQQALKSPGVRAVLIGEDVRRWSRPFIVGVKAQMEHWALALDHVRYVGEPVAVIVAEDRYLAEDALDLIRVDYETLTPVVSVEAAIAEGAPLLHPAVGSNVVSDRSFRYGDPQAAFDAAAHRVHVKLHYPRNSCTPIETGFVVAEHLPGDQGYDVVSNFMGPFSLHAVMALALNVAGNRLHHRIPRDSGGSFGVKQSVFAYVVLMCLAARKAGAPVKWVEDRLEHLQAATSATGRVSTVEAAVDADGRITALSYDQFDDVGGYLRAPEPATFYRMHGCLTGAYTIANVAVRNRVVVTNKTPAGLVRGFGGPQVYTALEQLVRRIARTLGLDVLEVYRRNFVPRDAFPYRAAAGALYDSGDYLGAMEKAVREGGLQELRRRRDEARAQGRLYGIGFAAIVEPSISNMGYITTVLTAEQRAKAGPKNGAVTAATVAIDLLGSVSVNIASAPAGQGHITVCAQVVADVFGLRPEDVAVNVEFDTQKDGWSVAAGNYSSRFAGAVAGTVHLAAVKVRDKIIRIVAHQLGAAPDRIAFGQGKVWSLDLPEQALTFARACGSAHWAPALLPEGESPGLRETVFWSPESLTAPDEQDRVNTSAAYGFAFDICAVEVDRQTGRVRIDRYVTTHDAGRILHPELANGQVRGAFAQGLGAALMEEFRYADDGGFQSGTFADYLVPTACEVPDPVIVHFETPSPFTPLGAKGLGEGNNMSTPPCIANAVVDALSTVTDIDDLQLPLTPSRLMALIGFDDPPPSGRVVASGGAVSALSASDGAVTGAPETLFESPPAAAGGRALTATGTTEIAAPPDAVFAVLLDPKALARVIPGCHELQPVGPNRYRADVTVGVGLVKARYEAQIELSELDPPRSLRLAGTGISSLGTARGSGQVLLEPTASGTRLHYDYRAEVGGKVAAVGSRMLDGAAKVVLGQLFEQLGRQAAARVRGSDAGASEDRAVGRRPSWWRRLLQLLRIVR